VFIVDRAHERSGRGENIVNEDKDSLLRCELDTFSAPSALLGGYGELFSLPDNVDELPNGQILSRQPGTTISGIKAQKPRHTAGTRYFFLSIVGMSLFSAFSQMTFESAIAPKELDS
jgi:hypothetical protein